MTLQSFKADVLLGETAEFRPCFNEASKNTLRAKTSKGIVFMDSSLTKSKKQLYVETSFDEDGNIQYNVTDIAPTFVL